jgi:hypothetical protein
MRSTCLRTNYTYIIQSNSLSITPWYKSHKASCAGSTGT